MSSRRELSRRSFAIQSALAGVAALSAGSARAQGAKRSGLSDGIVKIGVLTDMSGPYRDFAGPGSLLAARMAIEDFGPVMGKEVQLVSADHQNKPDVGSAIAR